MMNMITATTSTTNIMPVHTPALNIPSIAWQLLSIVMSANTENNCSFFIFDVLYELSVHDAYAHKRIIKSHATAFLLLLKYNNCC